MVGFRDGMVIVGAVYGQLKGMFAPPLSWRIESKSREYATQVRLYAGLAGGHHDGCKGCENLAGDTPDVQTYDERGVALVKTGVDGSKLMEEEFRDYYLNPIKPKGRTADPAYLSIRMCKLPLEVYNL